MEERTLFLGCPMWAHAGWAGRFYKTGARRADFLPQYASVFNAVEGNSTFYGLPTPESVARWTADTPQSFRFCFKLPRVVTHEFRLAGGEEDLGRFFERIAPLGVRLGPILIQMPASFGPSALARLDEFLGGLPGTFGYAVEVRHRAFFAEGAEESELDALLRSRGVDRVLFDTTGLFSAGVPLPDSMADVLFKKPRVPARRTVTGRSPVVRFIGDPEVLRSRAALRRWAAVLSRWIDEGLKPYFFAHHADDTHAPNVARVLHEELASLRPGTPKAATWPIEQEKSGADRDDQDGQMVFFP